MNVVKRQTQVYGYRCDSSLDAAGPWLRTSGGVAPVAAPGLVREALAWR